MLRDRESLRLLGPTRLPVLCVPAGTVLMAFDLSTVRGALFVANAATNIHLLRKRGMTTAFIGHGDSDKQASSNPFVKVYDELWVAGPAGAERYEAPDTTAVTGRVVEVGRPQAQTGGPRHRGAGPVTVLYAPTWEGWGDEPYHSSLPFEGVEIVRRLLAVPGLRLLYRPHPLTGTRSTEVRRAHLEVLELLRAAGAPAADRRGLAAGPRCRRRRPAPGRPRADGGPVRAGTAGPGGRAGRARRPRPPSGPPPARRCHASSREPGPGWPAASPAPTCSSPTSPASCRTSSRSTAPTPSSTPRGWTPRSSCSATPAAAAAGCSAPARPGWTPSSQDLLAGRDPDAPTRNLIRRHLLGSFPDDGVHRFDAALDRLVHHTAVPDRHG